MFFRPSLQTIVSIEFSCHCLSGCALRFLFFLKGREVFKNNFVLRWLCKLFDKALVCALACAALAMCLQIALAFRSVILVEVPIPLKIYYVSLLLWLFPCQGQRVFCLLLSGQLFLRLTMCLHSVKYSG